MGPRPPELSDLPSDLILKILNFLTVPHLGKTARLNRAFKTYTYSDTVYTGKLASLGLGPEGAPLKGTVSKPVKGSAIGLKSGAPLTQANGKANGAAGRKGGKDASASKSVVPPPKRPESPKKGLKDKGYVAEATKSSHILDGLLDDDDDPFGGDGGGKLPPALMDFPSLYKKSSETKFDAGTGRPRVAFQNVYVELVNLLRPFRGRNGFEELSQMFPSLPDRALALSKLKKFIAALLIDDSPLAIGRVTSTIQDFSGSLISSFDDALDVNDYDKMKEVAQASYFLEGGGACVQLFLSKNPVLFDPDFNPSLLATDVPAAAASDDFVLAENFANFMERLLANVKSQTDIITRVFPPETHALTVFIQAIFQASISDYLSAVLQKARTGDTVAYLNTLTTAVTYCSQFLDVIDNQLEDKSIWKKDEVWSSVKSTFEPYYNSYQEVELQAQRQRCERELKKWADERERKAKEKNPAPSAIVSGDVENFRTAALSAMKSVLLAPSYLTKSLMTPFRSPVDADDKLPHFEDLKLDEQLSNLVSLEVSLSIMHLNKDGVKRAAALANAFDKTQARPFVQSIFVVLLRYLGRRHMTAGFEEAIRRLANTRPSDDANSLVVESLSQFFELVHVADMIQQMVHIYYVDEIQKYVDESDFLSDVVVEKKQFEHVLDDQVASGMDSAIQVLMKHIEYILKTEQVVPEDFSPSPNVPLDLTPTKACKKVVAILYAHTRMIRGTTDKHILDVFFQEVGVRLHGVITKHLKKQQISTVGGLRVICDLTEYYNWAISLRNPEVTQMFSVLKEIGNLYIVETPADLKEMVHDTQRYQGQMRVEDIYELLQGRADWKKIQKDVEVSDCTIM